MNYPQHIVRCAMNVSLFHGRSLFTPYYGKRQVHKFEFTLHQEYFLYTFHTSGDLAVNRSSNFRRHCTRVFVRALTRVCSCVRWPVCVRACADPCVFVRRWPSCNKLLGICRFLVVSCTVSEVRSLRAVILCECLCHIHGIVYIRNTGLFILYIYIYMWDGLYNNYRMVWII